MARPALAQEDEWAEVEPRWIPSLSFRFDTFDYKTDTSVANLLNPPAQNPDPLSSGSTSNRQIQFSTDGELMGPIFEGLPGHPRLFASAGAQFNPFTSDEIFATGKLIVGDPEGDIQKFETLLLAQLNPPGGTPCNQTIPKSCSTREPGEFEGQGSEVEANFKQSWHAAVGVAFTFPVGESLLFQLKPSIAYNVDRVDLSGRITTVTEDDPSTWPNPDLPQYTVHRGSAHASTTDHSLGPGLELALALSRSTRPVRASLFADTRFLWLVSGRSTSFSDSVGSYDVRRNPFSFRAGAGVRLSWVGFDGD